MWCFFSRPWLLFMVLGFVSGVGFSSFNNVSLLYTEHFVRFFELRAQVEGRDASMNRAGAQMDGALWKLLSTPPLTPGQLQIASLLYDPSYRLVGGRQLGRDFMVANTKGGEAAMLSDEMRYELTSRVSFAWVGVVSALENLDALYWEVTELKDLGAGVGRPLRGSPSAEARFALLRSNLAQAHGGLEVIEVELRTVVEQLSHLSGESLSCEQSLIAGEGSGNAMQNEIVVCAVDVCSVQSDSLGEKESLGASDEWAYTHTTSALLDSDSYKWVYESQRMVRNDVEYLGGLKRVKSGDRIVF